MEPKEIGVAAAGVAGAAACWFFADMTFGTRITGAVEFVTTAFLRTFVGFVAGAGLAVAIYKLVVR
jgi:hypothetical protein